ncbi:MAG: class I SAM-dependent methyltransferase [Verrucomicrobia bacterium]|nr:class I SAM-dependent methyltransferase [Verrucomicrobiota bacterium]
MMKKPTERFSDRVENYVRYRPHYPEGVVDTLIDKCQLGDDSYLADIGSGTGIFTRHLLDKGLRVTAVEPNLEMRQAAEVTLTGYGGFTSVDGSAEATGLADGAVDLVVAAQAFHWFRHDETRTEFHRILKTNGWVALIWNQRKIQQPFQQDYDALLRAYAPDYKNANHMNLSDAAIASFFDSAQFQIHSFRNAQRFDKAGFLGRMQSSSYTPTIGTPEHLKLIEAAEILFARHEEGGRVSFEYDTRLFLGRIKE